MVVTTFIYFHTVITIVFSANKEIYLILGQIMTQPFCVFVSPMSIYIYPPVSNCCTTSVLP